MNSFKKEKQPGAGFDATSFDDSQLPLQLKKIIDHLGFLEKKIDTLLEQSRPRQGFRPPFGNRGFSGAQYGNFRPHRESFGSRPGGRFAGPGGHPSRPFQKRHSPHPGPSSHAA
ncbi:MAG: hypothetical protein COT00_03320 [Candidatus Omnitrophica bacterium CG07_land_8_20_14_0_80_50_8]|nr:MAG: hypothetical protein AUJ71_02080 [Candidatus Omnitrophica bacterium CG1_02_49_16]PIU40132.1 MAG: hypothetical protein COT00_03320 [Candidatus Omnitrophica bacterium CG07_land_8_20_14_0_80_50_8]